MTSPKIAQNKKQTAFTTNNTVPNPAKPTKFSKESPSNLLFLVGVVVATGGATVELTSASFKVEGFSIEFLCSSLASDFFVYNLNSHERKFRLYVGAIIVAF